MPLVSLIKSRFSFNSCTNGLDILYGDNVFGHAMLRNDFLVLDLDYSITILRLSLSHILIQISNQLNGILDLAILARIE